MKEMKLDEYCRQILTGATLEDKLLKPDKIVLNKFSASSNRPETPGRPSELAFNKSKAMKLPSVHMLDDARNRGILMHFFLNHELLALEIMALTILRFPDLPDSFKRGILKTMREEQEHASLYIERMGELGVKLGDVYVNRFFWDCLKDMQTPEQYVRSMSLTFEQANLDFSLYYKNAFELCGDLETAKVMERVYKDEISHVSFGLKWFRKWNKKGLSDWESYVSGLEFPLSPARAKGNTFDREGRKKCGLNDEFINKLEVTSFSRGRSPDVYIFNAFTESFIAQPSGFKRPAWGYSLEKDLSILPLVFAGSDDLLYMFRKPSTQHLLKLKQLGFELPQIEFTELESPLSKLENRVPGNLKPWGWSPEMNRLLSSLIKQCNNPIIWQGSYKDLYSKKWSLVLNRKVALSNRACNDSEDSLGIFCQSLEEVEKAVSDFTQKGWQTICVKPQFGASGRNILRFPLGKIDENQKGRLRNLLKKQQGLIVEPWLERLLDFSIHFDMKDKLKFIGVTRLINDEHGQYSATLFGKYEDGISVEIQNFLHTVNDGGLSSFYKLLSPVIEDELKTYAYQGPVGIDCFLYKGLKGEICFRPIVEINFRYTMGRVGVALSRKLRSGKCGLFKIFSILSERERESAQNLVKFKEEEIVLNKQGKWEFGRCLLNEWHDEIKFPAVISISDSLEECLSELS